MYKFLLNKNETEGLRGKRSNFHLWYIGKRLYIYKKINYNASSNTVYVIRVWKREWLSRVIRKLHKNRTWFLKERVGLRQVFVLSSVSRGYFRQVCPKQRCMEWKIGTWNEKEWWTGQLKWPREYLWGRKLMWNNTENTELRIKRPGFQSHITLLSSLCQMYHNYDCGDGYINLYTL